MHEVWVPSAFAVEQFSSSGVDSDKIVVVPEAVDSDLFDPAKHSPLELDPDDPSSADGDLFRFLSVFKFEKRKGWDLLLQAYFEEFSAADPVVLRLKTQAFHSGGDLSAKLRSFVDGLQTARRPLARYSVIARDLPLAELPRLYRAADAFVLPSRGEGWGRPHVEAMAMALPVIATNWSGSTEFLSERCSLPLRIDGLEAVEEGNGPRGHRWAVPSVAHLRSLMRWAAEHRAEAAEIGGRAREEMVARFSPSAIAREHVLPRLRSIARRLAAREDL